MPVTVVDTFSLPYTEDGSGACERAMNERLRETVAVVIGDPDNVPRRSLC